MEDGLGILWRNTQFWSGCLRAAGLLVLPSTPAEDREPWAWKTGPAGLAGGL